VNFVENCKTHSREVIVNRVNGIINCDKFNHSCDDLYLGITFFLGGGSTGYFNYTRTAKPPKNLWNLLAQIFLLHAGSYHILSQNQQSTEPPFSHHQSSHHAVGQTVYCRQPRFSGCRFLHLELARGTSLTHLLYSHFNIIWKLSCSNVHFWTFFRS